MFAGCAGAAVTRLAGQECAHATRLLLRYIHVLRSACILNPCSVYSVGTLVWFNHASCCPAKDCNACTGSKGGCDCPGQLSCDGDPNKEHCAAVCLGLWLFFLLPLPMWHRVSSCLAGGISIVLHDAASCPGATRGSTEWSGWLLLTASTDSASQTLTKRGGGPSCVGCVCTLLCHDSSYAVLCWCDVTQRQRSIPLLTECVPSRGRGM